MFTIVEEICNWSKIKGLASQPVSYQMEAVQGKAEEKTLQGRVANGARHGKCP